jgi:GT2 family glycosyltransferase
MEVIKSHGVGVTLNIMIGGYVARNRNELVETAKKNGSTHLMFIDNDQTFQPSAIQRLIDHDKDIVGANYNARGVPGKPIVSTVKLIDPETDPHKDETYTTEFPAQMFKCFGLGTGFMLINMSVFDKLEKPYFVAYEDPDGTHHTEDIEFCKKAGLAGFDVWCSPTIKVGHIGTYEY